MTKIIEVRQLLVVEAIWYLGIRKECSLYQHAQLLVAANLILSVELGQGRTWLRRTLSLNDAWGENTLLNLCNFTPVTS